MGKKSLSKEELIERLKNLPSSIDRPLDRGAMCYSIMGPQPYTSTCESCGKQVERVGYDSVNNHIKAIVNEMKALGYDVKVELLCSECASKHIAFDVHKILKESTYNVFFFKPKDQEKYHVAMSDSTIDYKIVLAFLNNKPTYVGSCGCEYMVREKMDVIKRMTGISVE